MNEQWMREALKEARRAYEKNEVPIGCVVVSDGGIAGRGHNLSQGRKNPLLHAEIIALDAAAKSGKLRRGEADLYVTVEPCPMCMGAILNARIRRLYIGADNPRFGAAGSVVDLSAYRAFNHSVIVKRGLLKAECGALMRDFFETLRAD